MISRKNAFFGLHFDLHPGKEDTELGADITEEMISALLERVKPDYVQYDCKGHAGYTGYPSTSRLGFTGNRAGFAGHLAQSHPDV